MWLLCSGNSKRDINFLGSSGSLRNQLRDNPRTSYKDTVAEKASDNIQFQPRNAKQTTYYNNLGNVQRKLGPDAILAVHEVAYMLPDFVWSIRTYPDLVICFGLPELLELPQRETILLSYDTTFKMGDFYLSVLVHQMSAYVERPCIPIAFVLHERKFQSVHLELCETLRKRLPANISVVLVTDGESAIVKAFADKFPSWSSVSCWNHIFKDVETWVKSHCGLVDDIRIYQGNVREILQCVSFADMEAKETTLCEAWSASFKDYYIQHLRSRVRVSFTGHLQTVGLTQTSITTNISESMHKVIKAFNEWKETTPDVCLVTLWRLQHFYKAEINRSATGFGPYSLVGRDTTTCVYCLVFQLQLCVHTR